VIAATGRKWRAAVVGAGVIGCRMDAPGTARPATHAGMYAAHPRFELCALADPDPAALSAAAGWGCRLYADAEEMLATERPDVVSLCQPTAARTDLLPLLADLPLRAVIAEKPLATDCGLGEAAVRRLAAAGIPLLVNLSRRYVPIYRTLAAEFAAVPVLSATIRYAKGVRHNGVHAIDLARLLFGETLAATALAGRCDHDATDPTVSAFLSLERCPQLFLQGLDERCFTHFELDVFTAQGRIVIDKDHRRLRRWVVEDGCGSPPGRRLALREEADAGHDAAMAGLAADLLRVLDLGAAPSCSGEDALKAERICTALAAAAAAAATA
jgi:predicted dehydrogenase